MNISYSDIETVSARADEVWSQTRILLETVKAASPVVEWHRQQDGTMKRFHLYGCYVQYDSQRYKGFTQASLDYLKEHSQRVKARTRPLMENADLRQKAAKDGERARLQSLTEAKKVLSLAAQDEKAIATLRTFEAATRNLPAVRWGRKFSTSAHRLIFCLASEYASDVLKYLAEPPAGEDVINEPWSGKMADLRLHNEDQYDLPLTIPFEIGDRHETFEWYSFHARLAEERSLAIDRIELLTHREVVVSPPGERLGKTETGGLSPLGEDILLALKSAAETKAPRADGRKDRVGRLLTDEISRAVGRDDAKTLEKDLSALRYAGLVDPPKSAGKGSNGYGITDKGQKVIASVG